jgi:manganese/zinc/iron transport system permease protein
VSDLLAILFFQAGHNATVVILGVMLLGAAAGLVGSLSLLRKRSLLGDAVAHSTLPGIAAAFLIAEFLKISYFDVILMATIPTHTLKKLVLMS